MSERSKHNIYSTPEWRALRLEILERDEWTCQLCGILPSKPAVHHKVPISINLKRAYDPRNLIVVCEECHKEQHRKQRVTAATYNTHKREWKAVVEECFSAIKQ